MGKTRDYSETLFNTIANGVKFRQLGLGFLWAWIYATWFTPAVFPGSTGLTINNDISWTISAGTVAVSLFVMPLLIGNRDISSIGWMRALSGLGTTAGAIMMAIKPLFGLDIPAVAYVGAVITGITSCWLWMLWGEFTGMVEQETAEAFVPLCVAVPLVIVFTCSFVSGPIAGVAVCLLPTVSSFMLELCLRDTSELSPVPLLSAKDRPPFWGDFIRVGFGSLAIYTCISFVWGTLSWTETGGGAHLVLYVVGGAVAILIAMLSISFSTRLDLFGLYRWLIPVILVSLVLLTIDMQWAHTLSLMLLTVAQYGFDIIVWIYFARMIRKGVCRGGLAIGINRGFVQAGVILGSFVAMWAPGFIARFPNVFCLQLIVMILMTATVSVVLMVLNNKERFEHTLASPVVKEREETPAIASIDAICDRLAVENGLTGREREILGYLAQGRSLPYIREELVLSKNTVETHAKNLYRKLDIHSRQELIDMVLKISTH